MHPTFNPNKVEIKKNPFELKRIGWGTFNVPIVIYILPWTGLKKTHVDHYISFDENGESHVLMLEVDRKTAEKNLV